MKNSDCDYEMQYILVGDQSTGKSCLVYRFIHNQFNDKIPAFVFIEFSTKTLLIEKNKVRFNINTTFGL